jgi:histidine phosphotransferase ChpT
MTNATDSNRPLLSALVGSRICHDLISPLGAIGNGVELLEMSGAAQTPEMTLISESVANANARIRFFRIAFGSANGGQNLGRVEILSVLDAVAKSSRVTYRWQPCEDLERGDVRIAFLLLMCLESAMPYGGEITVTLRDGTWRILGEAEKVKIDGPLWEGLASPQISPDVTPAQVHFALLPGLLQESDRRLRLDLTEGKLLAEF